jgi:anti-sigma factor ChrR (cupin superfamily)
MELHSLDHFTKGWFVGKFHPTLIDTGDVEVAVKHYRAGDSEARHHHRAATELTAVISGTVRMNGREIGAGQIIKLAPGISADFAALTDAVTVVVKHPGATHDKYPGEAPAPS